MLSFNKRGWQNRYKIVLERKKEVKIPVYIIKIFDPEDSEINRLSVDRLVSAKEMAINELRNDLRACYVYIYSGEELILGIKIRENGIPEEWNPNK